MKVFSSQTKKSFEAKQKIVTYMQAHAETFFSRTLENLKKKNLIEYFGL